MTVDEYVVCVGDLVLDVNSGEVHAGIRTAQLTPTESHILWFLMSHSPRVCSALELWHEVWASIGTSSTVRTHVQRVRHKIEDDPADPKRLVNIYGFGYRVVALEGKERGEGMAQIVLGSPEALAILKKDRPLREEAAKEARIEEAKRTGKIGRFEVFIEEERERSVMIEAWTDEEAQDIAKRDDLGYNESISGVERII